MLLKHMVIFFPTRDRYYNLFLNYIFLLLLWFSIYPWGEKKVVKKSFYFNMNVVLTQYTLSLSH